MQTVLEVEKDLLQGVRHILGLFVLEGDLEHSLSEYVGKVERLEDRVHVAGRSLVLQTVETSHLL